MADHVWPQDNIKIPFLTDIAGGNRFWYKLYKVTQNLQKEGEKIEVQKEKKAAWQSGENHPPLWENAEGDSVQQFKMALNHSSGIFQNWACGWRIDPYVTFFSNQHSVVCEFKNGWWIMKCSAKCGNLQANNCKSWWLDWKGFQKVVQTHANTDLTFSLPMFLSLLQSTSKLL